VAIDCSFDVSAPSPALSGGRTDKLRRQELDLLRHEWEKKREIAWHHIAKGRLAPAERRLRLNLAAQIPFEGTRSISTIASINLLSYIHGLKTNVSEVLRVQVDA
jgi:hypothetical protein